MTRAATSSNELLCAPVASGSSSPTLQRPSSPPTTIKVVLIGDAGVGKTSLRQRFLTGSFTQSYRATIGCDFISKSLTVEGQQVSLSIWDTAGQDRFRSLGASFYRGADACVLVYSSPESLASLSSWFDEFKTRCPVEERELADFCWLAVGNKTDLWEETGDGVSQEESTEVLDRLVPPSQVSNGDARPSSAEAYSVDDAQLPPPPASVRNRPPTPPSPMPDCDHHPFTEDPSPPSRIDVLPPPHADSRSHHFLPHANRTSTSFATHDTLTSTSASVYHDAASSFSHANGSSESVTSDDTITPATPDIDEDELESSGAHIFGWSASSEEFLVTERAKEMERGADVFMASSPPRTPPTLRVAEKTRYRGGPSAFRREDAMARTAEEPEEEPVETMRDIYDYSRDGIKEFRTSAKTGEGVSDLFDYVAKRVVWKMEKDKRDEQRRELGGEVIKLEETKKRSKWKEACCS